MLDAAVEHGGGLELLVHAAGNMYRGALEDSTSSRSSTSSRPTRSRRCCSPVSRSAHLRESRGAVVFFGSVHTQRAFPGASPYAATKGALETLTGVLAAELGPAGRPGGCVRPGGVLTEINQRAGLFDDAEAAERMRGLGAAHALGRSGTPDEVAEAVEYLARAEWATGAVLTIDGGLSLGVTNA